MVHLETSGHVSTDSSGSSDIGDMLVELLHRSCLVLLVILESEFLLCTL